MYAIIDESGKQYKVTTGDTIQIEGTPDGSDPAALDYIELTQIIEPVAVI